MASLFPSQAEADAQLDTILADMAITQAAALADAAKYDQYCTTVTSTVNDPDTGEPREVVSKAPLNEACQLTGATFTATLSVYDGPDGVGYVVVATVTDGVSTWQRAVNVGPETYRETLWAERTEA